MALTRYHLPDWLEHHHVCSLPLRRMAHCRPTSFPSRSFQETICQCCIRHLLHSRNGIPVPSLLHAMLFPSCFGCQSKSIRFRFLDHDRHAGNHQRRRRYIHQETRRSLDDHSYWGSYVDFGSGPHDRSSTTSRPATSYFLSARHRYWLRHAVPTTLGGTTKAATGNRHCGWDICLLVP